MPYTAPPTWHVTGPNGFALYQDITQLDTLRKYVAEQEPKATTLAIKRHQHDAPARTYTRPDPDNFPSYWAGLPPCY